MNNSVSNNVELSMSLPRKKLWKVSNITIIVIDRTLIEKMGIDEENIIFEEELTEGGIFLRLINNSSDIEQHQR